MVTPALLTDDVDVAAPTLADGGLVAFPTETVYGLGADARNPAAVARIFTVKGRPADHPLIVHLGDAGQLDDWAIDVPAVARRLAAELWPGPLTLLLRRHPEVDPAVTGGRDTIGVRVPAHPVAQALLARFGGGVAAPSANRFGRVSPTTAAHVLADLAGHLQPGRDVVLDGGGSTVGVESTIVDLTVEPPQLLRPGGVARALLDELLTGEPLAAAAGPSRAAGMLESHYAPRAGVVLVDDAAAAAARAAIAVGSTRILDYGDDVERYAAELYGALRRADDEGIAEVIAVLPPAAGLGEAVIDRLRKAAAPRP